MLTTPKEQILKKGCMMPFSTTPFFAHLHFAGWLHLQRRLRPDADVRFDLRLIPYVEQADADFLPPDEEADAVRLFLPPPPDVLAYASLDENLLVAVFQ